MAEVFEGKIRRSLDAVLILGVLLLIALAVTAPESVGFEGIFVFLVGNLLLTLGLIMRIFGLTFDPFSGSSSSGGFLIALILIVLLKVIFLIGLYQGGKRKWGKGAGGYLVGMACLLDGWIALLMAYLEVRPL